MTIPPIPTIRLYSEPILPNWRFVKKIYKPAPKEPIAPNRKIMLWEALKTGWMLRYPITVFRAIFDNAMFRAL